MSDWAPFATRWDGAATKIGYSWAGLGGPKRGAVLHSAEGKNWDVIHDLLASQLRRASWTFTIGYDRIEQHYPFRSHCWHAGDTDDDGGVRANIELVGIEVQGVAGEPLTAFQVEAEVAINRWCAEQEGFRRFARYPTQQGVWTLVEHNEVSDTPTACPSGRIPWPEILRRLEETMPQPVPTDAQRMNAARLILQAAETLLDRRELTEQQKAYLRYFGS